MVPFNSKIAFHSSTMSGRNSSASMDTHMLSVGPSSSTSHIRQMSRESLNTNSSKAGENDEPRKKNRISKDLEGMYAKVMKKNRLSNAPSQNSSPIPQRKSLNENADNGGAGTYLSNPDVSRELFMPEFMNKSTHASPSKNNAQRSTNVTSIDNDYETIDKRRARSSNCEYDQKDPGYETIPGDKHDTCAITKSAKLSRASAPPGEHNEQFNE